MCEPFRAEESDALDPVLQPPRCMTVVVVVPTRWPMMHPANLTDPVCLCHQIEEVSVLLPLPCWRLWSHRS